MNHIQVTTGYFIVKAREEENCLLEWLMIKKWFLETKNMAYVIGVDEDKNLQHLYWGEKLPYISDYPRVLLPQEFPFDNFKQIIKEEFSPWGGIRYKEPGLKVIYEDQVRDLILKYKTYKIKKAYQ